MTPAQFMTVAALVFATAIMTAVALAFYALGALP